jgi:hypothetical protein
LLFQQRSIVGPVDWDTAIERVAMDEIDEISPIWVSLIRLTNASVLVWHSRLHYQRIVSGVPRFRSSKEVVSH